MGGDLTIPDVDWICEDSMPDEQRTEESGSGGSVMEGDSQLASDKAGQSRNCSQEGILRGEESRGRDEDSGDAELLRNRSHRERAAP